MKGILTIPLVCIALSVSAQDCVLQRVINNAPEGAVITLGAGLYEGNITITKPLTIRSSESGAIIRGEGKDSVIRVSSPHVTLEGLEIEGSGKEHQSIDSCVYVSGAYNVSIRRNTLSDCLFGVNFEKTNQSVIEENRITSKRRSLGTRGDGIRLWYSHSNTVRLNQVDFVRDNVLWYSSGNRIEQNSVENSRYALHFMYANRNKTPNWNKLVLVPVQVTTTSTSTSSSSTSVARVSNELRVMSIRLVGGKQNQHEPVQISIVYNSRIDAFKYHNRFAYIRSDHSI